jgi:hypothetical protein
MREIVSPLSGIRSPFGGRVDPYKVAGFRPALVADMSKDYYRNVSRQTFNNIFTTSRLGNATMTDSDGLVKWAPHNLALNSATPATQSITVVSGADYTVECTGSGSITLSGAGTGTVTEGSPVEVTASTTSLTLTVVGSVDLMWCYRSDLGGMAPVPVDARVAGSTTYVPTTSTAKYLPRRHNHVYDGSAWVDAGTLIETEARTNYQTSIGAGTGVTVSSGISGSPSGASDANRFSKDATDPRYGYISYNLTVSSSTAYTVSAYFKWDGHDMITSLEYNNITNFDVAWRVDFSATSSGISISLESNATGNVEDVGNGWYRCSATFTSGASATGVNPSSLVQLTGGDGASILIYGAQLEAGSTPSSYIPTSGSTVTRAADSPLTIAGADVPWGSAVCIQMEGDATGDSFTMLRWYADANNYITQEIGASDFTFEQAASGTVDSVTGGSITSGINVPFNIASRHGSTFINGAVDGTALTADTTPVALPDLSSTDLQITYDFMGNVKQVRVWAVDIGDTGLEAATS